jgi:hypothetical protein
MRVRVGDPDADSREQGSLLEVHPLECRLSRSLDDGIIARTRPWWDAFEREEEGGSSLRPLVVRRWRDLRRHVFSNLRCKGQLNPTSLQPRYPLKERAREDESASDCQHRPDKCV